MADNSSRGTAWAAMRLRVLERDNYICSYCGNKATEADHIIPKAAGGKDREDNLTASCRRCNASKGAKTRTRNNWYNPHYLGSL